MKKITIIFLSILCLSSCGKINDILAEKLSKTDLIPAETTDTDEEWMNDYPLSSISINDKIIVVSPNVIAGNLSNLFNVKDSLVVKHD